MGRTLCEMHDARRRRYGTVGEAEPRHVKGEALADRFQRRLEPRRMPNGCLEATAGRKDRDGYPIFSNGTGAGMRGGRAALMIAGRMPPNPELQACHTCDNRACLDEEHLYWGTLQDNVADRDERHRYSTGFPVPEEMVEQLRMMYEQGVSLREMARLTGVERITIKRRLGLSLPPAFAKKIARHDPRRIEV